MQMCGAVGFTGKPDPNTPLRCTRDDWEEPFMLFRVGLQRFHYYKLRWDLKHPHWHVSWTMVKSCTWGFRCSCKRECFLSPGPFTCYTNKGYFHSPSYLYLFPEKPRPCQDHTLARRQHTGLKGWVSGGTPMTPCCLSTQLPGRHTIPEPQIPHLESQDDSNQRY